jgi:hypothetical protein
MGETGVCAYCLGAIVGRRAGARYCSSKCRVRACRARTDTPAARRSALLFSLEALKEENARLRALVSSLQEENARLRRHPAAENPLAADARRAKIARAEERARRVILSRGGN